MKLQFRATMILIPLVVIIALAGAFLAGRLEQNANKLLLQAPDIIAISVIGIAVTIFAGIAINAIFDGPRK